MPIATANGHRVRYELDGPPTAPVIAFSNSLGTTLEMWDAQVSELSANYRCLRFDTRGHGKSEVVAGTASVDDLALDFSCLLEVLGIDSMHLVGLSLGGMMGQAFAVRCPRQLRSLTLVSTTAHSPPPQAWEARASTVLADGMQSIADAVLQRWFTAPFLAARGAAVSENERRLLETSPQGYAHCCAIIGRLDMRERLHAIRCASLIVVGALDPATPPSMAEEIRTRIPGSRLIVLAGAAHLLAAERPRELNKILAAFVALNEARRAADV